MHVNVDHNMAVYSEMHVLKNPQLSLRFGWVREA
jgi:hypothetical protein